ncbi:Syntaxin-6 [Trichinella pseudospiralis]|uniref:GDP-fucose protein O-fucosyltransferase 1 n=1 Tax=Trichinella pseudospiralis TaxID=6337 RepID=A0A0V0XT45_TRIPS|nr:Syntaxin-6 [Trichinella pseudospiralis]
MTSSKSYKYVKLDSEPSTSFASRTIEQQELIIKSQDENLEKIGANVRVLRDMSAKIGFEIEEQSIMLDDLNADLDSTQAKMATVMNKMGKVMHMSAGRFGNQVEQFLGTLSFAKHINRTLVLPPFIEYDSTQTKMIRFTDYFQLKPLLKYHRAIEMSKFIRDVAPSLERM